MPTRDLILTFIVGVGLVYIFKHPAIGAYLWAWLSVMTPQTMTWSFAQGMPYAQAVAIAMFAVLVYTKQKQWLPWNLVTGLWAALLFWMTFTSFFAIAPEQRVFDRWIFVFKIQLMMIVSLLLVRTGQELKILVVVVTMSLAYFGIKGGWFTVRTGGGARVWGPGKSMLGGNNELAVGLVMILPYLYWMRQTITHPRWGTWIRRAMTVSIILCCFSILGSQSRGAFIAILAISLFLGLKSQHPVRMTLGIVTLVTVAIAFMPNTWNERMDTIKTYQEDESAMSRLYTWRTLTNAALDRPIVGAGFSADNREVFSRYAPKGEEWKSLEGRIWVAHSIYFQMLGEHGFVGFGIWFLFWLAVWRTAGKIAKRSQGIPEFASWMPLLMKMTQVSLIGFASGGAFLSLAYLDLTFYFAGYVILAGMLVTKSQVASKTEAASSAVARATRPTAGAA
jgi:probable O-glycosylation ligase (exosortase A-associated)